VKEWENI